MIDGKEKLFTAEIVPMLAKRTYMKIQAEAEALTEDEYTTQHKIDEEDALVGMLANVVFKGEFTPDQVFEGATDEYVYGKIREAVFGIVEEPAQEDEEGN